MNVWECPECGANNKMALVVCFCGYVAKGDEKETIGKPMVKKESLDNSDIKRIKQDASKKIKFAASILYLLGGLLLIAGLFLGDAPDSGTRTYANGALILGIIIIILTIFLHRFKSSLAAILLSLLPVMNFILEFAEYVSAPDNGLPIGRLLTNIVILLPCLNALLATFDYKKSINRTTDSGPVIL